MLGDEPAYPSEAIWIGEEIKQTREQRNRGMSKRDLFAAMAMQGMEAGLGIDSRRFELMIAIADSEGLTMAEIQAREAVLAADALLAELDKGHENED